MIAYLEGKVIASRSNLVILDVNGVGYKVFCNNDSLGKEKDKSYFFIHQHIREDINDLYGFKTFEGLELFEKLISVNGVGPKAGMAIMSGGTADKIISAIAKGDAGFFQLVPGIGKKVAAKIILDLKSKITNLKDVDLLDGIDQGDDTADALISLGYKREEVHSIIQKIPSEIEKIEEKVKWCLRNIKKN